MTDQAAPIPEDDPDRPITPREVRSIYQTLQTYNDPDRGRNEQNWQWGILGTIVLILCAVTIWGYLGQQKQNQARYEACDQRNQQAIHERDVWLALAAPLQPDKDPSGITQKLVNTLHSAADKTVIIDCSIYQ